MHRNVNSCPKNVFFVPLPPNALYPKIVANHVPDVFFVKTVVSARKENTYITQLICHGQHRVQIAVKLIYTVSYFV